MKPIIARTMPMCVLSQGDVLILELFDGCTNPRGESQSKGQPAVKSATEAGICSDGRELLKVVQKSSSKPRKGLADDSQVTCLGGRDSRSFSNSFVVSSCQGEHQRSIGDVLKGVTSKGQMQAPKACQMRHKAWASNRPSDQTRPLGRRCCPTANSPLAKEHAHDLDANHRELQGGGVRGSRQDFLPSGLQDFSTRALSVLEGDALED